MSVKEIIRKTIRNQLKIAQIEEQLNVSDNLIDKLTDKLTESLECRLIDNFKFNEPEKDEWMNFDEQ